MTDRTNPKSHKTRSRGGADAKISRSSHIVGRLGLLVGILLIPIVAIVFMLVHTTVLHRSDWTVKADSTLNRVDTIRPDRGDILADDGSLLATNLTYYTLSIDFRSDKFMVIEYNQAIDSLADSLSKYFPQRDRREWRQYLHAPLSKPRSKRPRTYRLLRKIPYDKMILVRDFPFFKRSRNPNRTGLKIEDHTVRAYPYGGMAQLSVGRVGEVVYNVRDTVKDGPERGHVKVRKVSRGVHGISGLEYALDSLLYGKPGLSRKVMFTNKVAPWVLEEPQPGYTITTTIDITMQDIVEQELEAVLREYRAEWGTAILMHVPTGDIKAISNLERDSVKGRNARYIEAMNRAMMPCEPGSVLKAVSMTVALADGLAGSRNRVFVADRGGYTVNGYRVTDTHYSPTGTLTLMDIIPYSSNISFAKMMMPHFQHDINSYRERVRKLGLLERWGTGIAGERPAWFPTLDPKRGGAITLTQQMFGYGCMIPPLYTCAFYNAIANDGKFVKPRLMSRMQLPESAPIDIPVSYVRESICTPEQARLMREMFHGVVHDKPGGTAWRLWDEDCPVDFGGKTGTARIANERDPKHPELYKPGYIPGVYRLAFCGFFPYEKPQYTLMVLMSKPTCKGAWACSGVTFKNIMLKMYARGMLGKTPDYRIEGDRGNATRAHLYAFDDPSHRQASTVSSTYAKGASVTRSPKQTAPGTVPDVKGLGLRQALVKLESAGYNVRFSGTGAVQAQNPTAGVGARRGSTVHLTLAQ